MDDWGFTQPSLHASLVLHLTRFTFRFQKLILCIRSSIGRWELLKLGLEGNPPSCGCPAYGSGCCRGCPALGRGAPVRGFRAMEPEVRTLRQEKAWSYKDSRVGGEGTCLLRKVWPWFPHPQADVRKKKKISGKMAFSEPPPSSLVRKGGGASESQE